MKIYKLDEESKKMFYGLDPLSMLPRAELGGFALGGFERNESTGFDEPVSLAVCTVKGDMLIIFWLWVEQEYRGNGFAAKMLDELLVYADMHGLKRIAAYFNSSSAGKALCVGAENFFEDHGFTEKILLPGEWTIDVKTALSFLKSEELFSKVNVVQIKDILSYSKKKYYAELENDPNTAVMFPISKAQHKIDEDVSCMLVDDEDKIVAAMLFAQSENVLFPVCMYFNDERFIEPLLVKAFTEAKAKFGTEALICTMLLDGKYRDITDDLLSMYRLDNYLLATDLNYLRADTSYDQSYYDEFAELPHEISFEEQQVKDAELVDGEDVILTVEEVLNAAKKLGNADTSGVESVGSLGYLQMQKILIDCDYHGQKGAFNVLPNDLDVNMFELDLSCCIRKDGAVRSVLLVVKDKEGSLRPVIFYAGSKNDTKLLLLMIKYAAERAAEIYKKDTKVLIRCHDESSRNFSKLLSE